jgi:gallate decarboxylase subunit C
MKASGRQPIHDLRSALEYLAAKGETVTEVATPTDPDVLIADYIRRYQRFETSVYCDEQPLVRYTRAGTAPIASVVMGLFGARRRNRWYLDPLDRHPDWSCGQLLRRALASRVPPKQSPAPAPCQENIVENPDLLKWLPAPRLAPADPAPSITLGLVYATDEQSAMANCSFHRISLWNDGHLTLWIAPNRHLGMLRARAAAAGKRLPVSINIGLDPAVYLAACCTEPDMELGGDELAVAGALRASPIITSTCKTSSARCIAHAEIVIEGTIGPENRLETADGSAGWSIPEYLGYRREAGAAALMRPRALTFRHGALFQALTGPGREQSEMLGIAQELTLLDLLERSGCEIVRDVHCCASGGGNLTVVLKLDKRSARDDRAATEIGRMVASTIACVKHVFLVDPDVNIFSQADVMWALTTRFRADVDLTVLERLPGTSFDPTQTSVYAPEVVDGTVAKCIFDCSVPYAQRSRFARAFAPAGATA